MRILDSVAVHIQGGEIEMPMDELATIVDALKEPIKCLFNDMDDLKKQLKEQKEIVKELSEEWKKLKKFEEDLLIGQMVSIIEKEMVKYILKDAEIEIDYITIKNLSDALNGRTTPYSKGMFKSRKQEMKANENWARLDDVLNLDSQVYCAIDSFKQNRNYKAHPKLKVDDVCSHLSTFQLDEKDKAMISRMTDIWMNLQSM